LPAFTIEARLPDGRYTFETQNPNLGKFCRVFQCKVLAYFMAVWSILQPFGIFVAILYILSPFGTFFPFWYVVGTKKNLATLHRSHRHKDQILISFHK
jgi:hypothetical protein